MKPEEIKRIRQALGLTQPEFAKRVLGSDKTTQVSRWENGKHTPHPIVVNRIRELQREGK